MKVLSTKILLTDKKEEKRGGLFIPRSTGQKVLTVSHVGTGHWNPYISERVPLPVKVGDRVAVDMAMVPEVKVKDKDGNITKYYITIEQDILYILDKDEEVL